MLAGCSSSTLLSPRHRLRSETSAVQFQACHFQTSMSTQRLDLPCNFSRKETSKSQTIRPAVESKAKTSSCSIKQNIRLPPLTTTSVQNPFEGRIEIKGKSLKRFAEQGLADDETVINRAKRKRGSSDDEKPGDDHGGLSLGQLGAGNFWFQPSLSGDEERGTPPLPLSNNPWIDSVITELTDAGEKDVEMIHRPGKEASGSGSTSTSSESRSLGPPLNVQAKEHERGNGSGNPYLHEGARLGANEEEIDHREHEGFELVRLLAACVEAIGSKNIAAINHFISKLGELASPRGTVISRLTAYYTEALALRVTRVWPHIFHITTPRELDRLDDDNGTALRLLNQVTPILRFVHFTSNEILLRAFEGKDRVHIVDFDIKQGLQWPSLFQSLASRTNPPSHVRVTGIGESKQELNETGDRLAGFAEALNLPFEFHPVVDRLEDVRLWMLHAKENESIAVNCVFQLHKTLYDGNGGVLRDFLGLIRSINPIAVIIAEQETENNILNLEARVANSLRYYSAIFDSIDSTLPLESPVRIKIEEMFAREIRNLIACEGSDRFERHTSFEKWRKLMEQGGFKCMGITDRELVQSQMLLKMYTSENYSVKKQGPDGDDGALTLSWLDEPLYTVSAWTPIDVAGSSSSFSQPS
ncbi:hypothetical protein Golax_020161 [Gossypium laxum]|uniref:Scarecrow-like protein 28 n=1 Tax=Gossypium laxum TaxID=34288 RepID=A0A7J8Z8W0_9ROSI|nr:hypothetical protein [Gossypium laxum]